MRPPLAPVHARKRETAAQPTGSIHIYSQPCERSGSPGGELVRIAVRRVSRHPSHRADAVMKRNSQAASDVIVASPRGAQRFGRAWHKYVACSARENTQGFQGGRHVRPFQAVVAMLPLSEYFDQSAGQE